MRVSDNKPGHRAGKIFVVQGRDFFHRCVMLLGPFRDESARGGCEQRVNDRRRSYGLLLCYCWYFFLGCDRWFGGCFLRKELQREQKHQRYGEGPTTHKRIVEQFRSRVAGRRTRHYLNNMDV